MLDDDSLPGTQVQEWVLPSCPKSATVKSYPDDMQLTHQQDSRTYRRPLASSACVYGMVQSSFVGTMQGEPLVL